MKILKADAAKINEVDMFQASIFDETGNFIANGYGRTKEEADTNAVLIVDGFNSKQQLSQGFDEIVRPVIKWLNDNYHPHVTMIITPTNAELTEGIKSTGRIMDYVKD